MDIASVSCGPYIIYANFLHHDNEDVLNTSVWDLVNNVISSSDTFEAEHSRVGDDDESKLVRNESFLDLTVVVEDAETGNKVKLPPIRVARCSDLVTALGFVLCSQAMSRNLRFPLRRIGHQPD